VGLQHRGDAAPNDNDVRFEQVNDISQPEREELQGFLDHLTGERIAGSDGLTGQLAGHAVRPSTCQIKQAGIAAFREPGLGAPSDSWAGRERFDAAKLATFATRAAVVNTHMPAFAGSAGAGRVVLSIHQDGGSDPGTYCGVEDVSVTATGTPESLGQSGDIGIIIQFDGDPIDARHFCGQGEIAPAGQVWRIQHDAGFRIQRSRRTDSYALYQSGRSPGFRDQLFRNRFDGRRDGSQGGLCSFITGHGNAHPMQNPSPRLHDACGDFGAADVYPDDESFGSLKHALTFQTAEWPGPAVSL